MTIRDMISALDARLTLSLTRFPQDAEGWVLPLPQPVRLTKRVAAVTALFDEGRPAEPPSQARINALDRLRQGKVQLTRKDWNLIAWGMCDDCGLAGKPIETNSMFEKIMQYVDAEIAKGISRKVWFGLLHSYFAYPLEQPENNPNWLTLRTKLAATLPILIQSQVRPKAWSRALESQSELLTANAGIALGKALFDGDKKVEDEIRNFLPIPETSWLWRKIIGVQLTVLLEIGDERFCSSITSMLNLAKQHPHQSDDILSGLLTRYECSGYRDEPHAELKQFALDQWQNPQIKSANRWSLVGDDVLKMMLHWFAKADLEHFFSLLQGEGGVDRARLHYWLRFVDQISYTRIVMGGDAFLNRSADFTDFRTKNKGRFSQLSGGDSANNAFIMRIGDYYFVEFSGKGNACYVYSISKMPFNPETRNFQLGELKRPSAAIDRIIHNGAWEYKADYLLARLGIFPGKHSAKKNRPSPITWPPELKAPSTASASISSIQSRSPLAPADVISTQQQILPVFSTLDMAVKKTKTECAIEAALELAMNFHLVSEDHRAKGGAFWILEKELDSDLRKKLNELGFGYVMTRGYWIK